jgi:hypothetical protein
MMDPSLKISSGHDTPLAASVVSALPRPELEVSAEPGRSAGVRQRDVSETSAGLGLVAAMDRFLLSSVVLLVMLAVAPATTPR